MNQKRVVFGPPITVSIFPSKNTTIRDYLPTSNYSTDTSFYVGESATLARLFRGLLQFDLSWLPATAVLSSSILKLYCSYEASNNNRNLEVHRLLQAWINAQATWNIRSTGTPWQTPGAFGTLDCEQSAIATLALSASETLGEYKNILLPYTKASDLDQGFGWLLKMAVEDADQYGFISMANSSNKPILQLTFTELAKSTQQFSAIGDSKSLISTNSWPASLTTSLNVDEGATWAQLVFAATAGVTVAVMRTTIDAQLAAISIGTANCVLSNLGANDVQAALPAEAVWKANYLYILDAVHTKWPDALVYITKPWARDYSANCDIIAGWIDGLIASCSFALAGDDERIWMEGGDNGATMANADGIHYSAAGQVEKTNQMKTVLGY